MVFSGFFVCAECKPFVVGKLARGEVVGGVWRDRNGLVIAHGRLLPDRCIRCNEPCGGYRLKRNLYWYHPAIYLLLLFSPVIPLAFLAFLIVALVIRKKAKVDVPICTVHREQRKRRLIVSVSISVAAVIAIVGTIAFMKASALAASLGVIAGIALLGSVIAAVVFGRMVEPTKIDATYAFLKGARAPFLAEFPEWPRA